MRSSWDRRIVDVPVACICSRSSLALVQRGNRVIDDLVRRSSVLIVSLAVI